MEGLSKQRVLEDLRTRIESVEKHPRLARKDETQPDSRNLLDLPLGYVHEVFTDEERNTGAALGFALAAAHRMQSAHRPAILIMQLVRDSQHVGVPYALGLSGYGIDPETIVLCRPDTTVELLWAVEEAIACKSVAAVIADVGHEAKVLDFTATRRLSLRSSAGGSSVFLIRYGKEREATAARFRWRIEPYASGQVPFDPRAPGRPRLAVDLEKGRLGSHKDPLNWTLDVTENGFVLAEPQKRPEALPATGAPLPGVAPAALGYRLSQAG
jgi:protein ImuA